MKTQGKKEIFGSLMIVLFLSFILIQAPLPARAGTITIDSIDPVLLIEKVSSEQAVAGSEFNLTLSIRNISNNPGFNLNLSFKVEGTDSLDPFTVKDSQATTIDKIDGNATRTVMVAFTVKPEAQNKDYKLIVNLSGQNASFQNTVNASTTITIPVTYDLTKPVLLVKSASISPENPDLVEGFDVHLQIWNMSKTTDARNVTLLLDGTDNFEVMEISNKKNIVKLEKNTYETVTYRLRAKDTRANNTVKLTLKFDYLGDKTESVEETINLPLPREDVGIGATPWVIINKYTLSAERVLAGNTVTLRLYIENTNQRPVKNVKISLGVIKIEDSSSTGTTGGKTTGGTVFSPVNSSNSFFIDYIPGKTVLEKDIDLYVDPNAAAKTYIVPVEIKYEDRKGTTLTSEELVNIPVTQECKLQILSVQVPPTGFMGQPIPVTAEFVNVGKVALGNFIVTLEGDFEKDNGTYYIGNFDIGVSDMFQGGVIARDEGKVEGKLVFSYIDNNNKDVRVEHPFTIEVQGRPVPPPGQEGEMMGPDGSVKPGMPVKGMPLQKGSFLNTVKTKWPTFLLGLVIILEGIYIWRLKRKKASEEFFNE
ncbi:MAG: S-layer domain-like protein [Peptococcaceae bacterium]|jgi:hypothetical protein|nr:S-layer domain-like protein [Peptococcaceae bacterium]